MAGAGAASPPCARRLTPTLPPHPPHPLSPSLARRHRGFEIAAFPCNAFGQQEPGSGADIKAFCTAKYNVSFTLYEKVDCLTHPVFEYLRRHLPEAQGGGGGKNAGRQLSWNFNKLLVSREGVPTHYFFQDFDAPRLEAAIRELLGDAAAGEEGAAASAAQGGAAAQQGAAATAQGAATQAAATAEQAAPPPAVQQAQQAAG